MSCCPVNTVQEGASHDVPQSLQKSLYSDILMFHHPAYAINLPVFSSYSPYFHTTSSAVECYILYQLSFISHFHKLENMFQMAYGTQGNLRSWCCPCWPSADLSERPNSGKFQTHGLLSGGVNNESTRFDLHSLIHRWQSTFNAMLLTCHVQERWASFQQEDAEGGGDVGSGGGGKEAPTEVVNNHGQLFCYFNL